MSPFKTVSSCGSSSSDVRRRNVPKRVRRSSPSTPPGAVSCGRSGTTSGSADARIERNLSISNSLPSRPTRGWRKNTGRPTEISVPSASSRKTGSAISSSAPATRRSTMYLRANCQPFGFACRVESSGSPPMCSIVSRPPSFSKRRGTSETETPSSSQCLISRRRTSLGAVEKVTTTCSMPCCSIRRSRSQLAPSTGSGSAASSSGSLSTKPTGSRPSSGYSSSRRAASEPTRPAPTISVGRAASRRRRALSCAQSSAIRPAVR